MMIQTMHGVVIPLKPGSLVAFNHEAGTVLYTEPDGVQRSMPVTYIRAIDSFEPQVKA